jgi:PAS domain S-box-containing protein
MSASSFGNADFFESLVEQSPAAILTIDEDVNVKLWNPAAERLFGCTADAASGPTRS